MIRLHRHRQVVPWVGLPALVIERNHGSRERRQRCPQALLGHDQRCLAVRQHVAEPLLRQQRVQGQVGRPGLHYRQQRDHHVGRAFHTDAPQAIGSGTVSAQLVRQLVGPRVDLCKRE